VRVAGSLKVGTVHASTLVQALQRRGRPATLGRAIAEPWVRLAPFFQLSGVVISSQRTVAVQLCPFNDRQYSRDLSQLCQRVNEKHLHLPDGRLLLFSIQGMAHPILHQQQRLNA